MWVLTLLAACTCQSPGPPPEASPAPEPRSSSAVPGLSAIVVVMDTVRADHLSLYGYGRPTSPRLDAFAQRAIRFDRAMAAAPWTLPSHASLFTGLYPFEHGAHTYPKGDVASPDFTTTILPLPDEALTLAEYLRDVHGYETGAVVANRVYLGPSFGVDQGFEHYDNEAGRATDALSRGLAWIDATERPFFLFVNLMDAHRPYNCHEREGFPYHGPPKRSGMVIHALHPYAGSREPLPPLLVEQLVDMYDTALANQDEALGAFLDALAERGRMDDTVVLVTSDHGEYLGEHDLVEHSKDVYQGAIHVPMVLWHPGLPGGSVDDELVSLVHAPGLLLEAMHIDAGESSLLRHWPRGEPVLAENYYTRSKDLRAPWGARYKRVRTAVFDATWKYIESSDEHHELFALDRDPLEAEDRLAAEPEVSSKLRQLGSGMTATGRYVPERIGDPELGADEEQELIRLGYLDEEGGEL